MNAFGLAPLLFATVVSHALFSSSLILRSDAPLPAGLEKAVAREIALAGRWQPSQVDVYVEIHGSCRVSNQPAADVQRPLGWVDRVDGEMLSIINVDCLRIGEALWRIVVNPQSTETRELMARAIARVICHEFRHISLNTTRHEKRGDYKASLRAEELVAPFTTY